MLSAADRSRVEKLANMLASDFDGERANAGALLARMASERKVTVAELLGLAQGPATAEPPSPSRLWDEDVDLLDRLAAAVNFTSVLTPWEREYAADVSRRYVRAARLFETLSVASGFARNCEKPVGRLLRGPCDGDEA